MNRFDIINRIGDKYRVGNTETGEFSYAQALKTVGKDIKDYQKATTGTQHKFLDIRFENERLVLKHIWKRIIQHLLLRIFTPWDT